MSKTLSPRNVELFEKSLELALIAAMRLIVDIGDKKQLDDAKDKVLYIRAERTIYSACEALDRISYSTEEKYMNGAAYKNAKKALANRVVSPPKASVAVTTVSES